MSRIPFTAAEIAERYTLHGAHVLDTAQGLNGVYDVHVERGRIKALGKAPVGFTPEQSWSLEGCLITPGLIDLGPHLREPGPSYKGSLASEARAGLSGGYTTLCPRPDTSPILDNAPQIQTLLTKARALEGPHILPLGALTKGLEGELLSNMAGLKAAGCAALTNGRAPITDTRVALRCLDYAATFDIPVHIQPEDAALAAGGCAHDGAVAARLGLSGIPAAAETIALAQWLVLVEQTGVRAHFSRLSTAKGVEAVAAAKARGLPVTADVSIMHLHWTDQLLEGFDSRFHFQPPLRGAHDRDALRAGVESGVIDAIVSDHLPHEAAAKLAPFAESQPGITSLETCWSMGMALVEEGGLSLERLIDSLTAGPARVLGCAAGTLKAQCAADIAIFDRIHRWTPTEGAWQSVGTNTPLAGVSMNGRCVATIVDGKLRHAL
ncbi:dihydroorotase [Larsenimonas suaedae]|uniref:Dihydroorotase n=1 Tax=Larsenimonas suaedae TaxID=1851019 RepID=A0ABU1GSJ7_9GAMM|nr:dihydroorotase [Larsenimonas suaedae]MCM2972646.1 dihydroorotase [Larsenimonas suaedae]MDR5894557.1 dihydroorotase [Larsenimonas suaedae]